MASSFLSISLPLFASALIDPTSYLDLETFDGSHSQDLIKLIRSKRFTAKDYCKATHKPISQERMINEIICTSPVAVEYIHKTVRKSFNNYILSGPYSTTFKNPLFQKLIQGSLKQGLDLYHVLRGTWNNAENVLEVQIK